MVLRSTNLFPRIGYWIIINEVPRIGLISDTTKHCDSTRG